MSEKWKVIRGDVERREMSRIVRDDDPEFLVGYVLRESMNKGARAEDDARADVIAAAPDMLAALKSLVSGIGNDPTWKNESGLLAAIAAIAKAEPKS